MFCWTAEGFSCSMDVLHGVEVYGYLYKLALLYIQYYTKKICPDIIILAVKFYHF